MRKPGHMYRLFVAILRSVLRLFVRKQHGRESPSQTEAATAKAPTPDGRQLKDAGFNMKMEIAKLAERIVEPVSSKVPPRGMEPVIGQIRSAFEQLDMERATANADFEAMAANIIKPVQPMLSDVEFARIVDRLRGAMAGFCQGNRIQSAVSRDASPRPTVSSTGPGPIASGS